MTKSKIEWTDATWNPTVGCSKISAGCKNCYAEKMANRLRGMGVKGYENGFELTLLPERLNQPLINKKPTKYFVNSMSDLFHEEIPIYFLDSIFDIIKKTPQHIYQILTKRDELMRKYFFKKKIPRNVWLGVTVENKSEINRIDNLRDLNASIKFLSIEPLLEEIGTLNLSNINWVIVGGESGHNARPMNTKWVVDIKKQCDKQDVHFFFKQWGTWGEDGVKRNKKLNGRIFLGREWNEMPEYIYTN